MEMKVVVVVVLVVGGWRTASRAVDVVVVGWRGSR